MASQCPICARRRGKRFCPGLARSRWAGQGETLCAPCCGEQREVTIDCPSACPYLLSGHRYEAQRSSRAGPRSAEAAFSNVVIEQDFLEEQQPLISTLGLFLVQYAEEQAEVRDPDVLAALEALGRTYQTLDSGLYYEQPPAAGGARALYTALRSHLEHYTQEPQQRRGSSPRADEVLRAAVFLLRVGQVESNGRPLSRRYLGFLKEQLPAAAGAEAVSKRLIIPG